MKKLYWCENILGNILIAEVKVLKPEKGCLAVDLIEVFCDKKECHTVERSTLANKRDIKEPREVISFIFKEL